MSIQRWEFIYSEGAAINATGDGDYVLHADHVAAVARAEQRVREDERSRKFAWSDGYAAALDRARDAVAAFLVGDTDCDWTYSRCLAAIDALQTSLSGPAAVRTSEPEPPTSVAPAGEDHGAPADPQFRFSRSVECIHHFKTFDQIDGGKHAKCVLCGFKEPAEHVKPIYVDAWDGMAVPYDDHVIAVEAAHAAGMREALADFLTSIDEDDPVYLQGYAAALDAARDAVAAVHVTRICPPGTKAALAAIDGLREESQR